MGQSKFKKLWGCIILVIGTCLGGGMLALPLTAFPLGLNSSLILLIIIYTIMTNTGIYILNVCSSMPIRSNNIGSMTQIYLGKNLKLAVCFLNLLLFYSLCSAYISGLSSISLSFINDYNPQETSIFLCSIFIVSIFGGTIFFSTKTADYFNRGLFSFKMTFLVICVVFLFLHIDYKIFYSNLFFSFKKDYCKAIPIFICCFGFHALIPSLVNYIEHDKKNLKIAIIAGTTTSLIIYILWLLAIFGNIPSRGENSFENMNNQLDPFIKFMEIMRHKFQCSGVNLFFESFINIAMTTSFLGVSLGLFDFIADSFYRKDSYKGRLQTTLLTFMPPILIASLFPKMFTMMLKYAAIFITILQIILPSIVYFMHEKINKNYYCLPLIISFIGLLLIFIEIYAILNF